MSTERAQGQEGGDIRAEVRQSYGRVARGGGGCCGSVSVDRHAEGIGYSADELAELPEGANLGLGCGNPTALTAIQPGETVLDLGSGGGLDVFLAAQRVGETGRAIGIDMTPEMLERARRNAVEMGVHGRVEFREGVIEALPVASDSVDVILSNCVINLSPDKPQVFREAYRVLRRGGRLAISDILLSAELPEAVRGSVEAYTGCVAGAILADDYLTAISDAGFVDVTWTRTPAGDLLGTAGCGANVAELVPGLDSELVRRVADSVWSYQITARKP